MRLTDGRTDGQTERPWNYRALPYMQSHGKNCPTISIYCRGHYIYKVLSGDRKCFIAVFLQICCTRVKVCNIKESTRGIRNLILLKFYCSCADGFIADMQTTKGLKRYT